jgi:hypothetical protein
MTSDFVNRLMLVYLVDFKRILVAFFVNAQLQLVCEHILLFALPHFLNTIVLLSFQWLRYISRSAFSKLGWGQFVG